MRLRSAMLALLALAPAARAGGFVEYVSPPVAERGKATRVTFHGRELAAALDVWTSLPAGALRATPLESTADRAVFDVAVAADAPVGLCGLRVATRDGLTNLHLFLIDDLPVRPGVGDTALTPPAAVWGTLREAAVDRYRLTAAAGERVSFEVVASRFGKDADPLLTIRDAAGAGVAERDNDPGLIFDSRFEHTFAAAGAYSVEVRDARYRGSDRTPYVLRVGRFPAGRVALPAAVEPGFHETVHLPEVPDAAFGVAVPRTRPGPFDAVVKRPGDHGSAWVPLTPSAGPVTVAEPFDAGRDAGLAQLVSPGRGFAFGLSPTRLNPFLAVDRSLTLGRPQATTAVVPGTLCGVLRVPCRADTFRLRLQKGERLFFRGEARALNSPADLELIVTDRTGRELRRAGEQRDEVNVEFTAPAAGDYGLTVRDTLHDGGPAFAYRVAVRRDPFPPELVADVEGLTVPRGSYQPVPITASRPATGPTRLLLTGGPPGLRLAPEVIPAGATAVVCRLEANATTPVGVYTVQIFAEVAGEWAAVRSQPLVDRRIVNVDLIPHALREDQRRLPAAVGDRFAVQVTPPAPFAFELPEPVVNLPRYQQAAIPVVVARTAGFDGPVTFAAVGGQLADKTEGRTRVYAEFPTATATAPAAPGVVVSKILSNLGKSRIDVTATGTHSGRRVSLTRTFELELTTAFRVTAEPAKLALLPGESARARLVIARVKSFDGPVTLRLAPLPGFTLPETLTVPKGAASVEVEVAVPPAAAPGRYNLAVTATGDVDGFEEETRGAVLEIEVRPPPKPN